MSLEHESADEGAQLGLIVIAVLAAVVVGGAIDLVLDRPQDWLSPHVLVEATLMVVSTGVALMLLRAWRRTKDQLIDSTRSVAALEADRQAWRQRAEQALTGLAGAIDDQFDRWELTPTEREIALLLLKGYGHKQIAGRTNRSESTVRQHAVSVYHKSGQGGRAELAAFFLDGVMLPSGTADTPRISAAAR
jgi:DNA-binding NarL/FixJ family response regulator